MIDLTWLYGKIWKNRGIESKILTNKCLCVPQERVLNTETFYCLDQCPLSYLQKMFVGFLRSLCALMAEPNKKSGNVLIFE